MRPVGLEDWRREGRWFGEQGRRLFYREVGRGETLLLVHGFPTASWDWHRIWPELAARFRAIAPDLLGFGFSDKPPRHHYSIPDQADRVEALLDASGATRAHVLAHDYGDTVAQELLARFLDRSRRGAPGLELRSVCFLNGGLFPETHRARPVQRLLASPLGALAARFVTPAGFGRGLAAVFGPDTRPSETELREFWSLFEERGGRRIAHRLIRYMDERRRHRERWVGALCEATIPLRLVNGPADPVSGAHMAARYREIVPAADVVLLGPRIGHYPQLEDPDGVLRAFLEFQARLASPGSGQASARATPHPSSAGTPSA